MAQFQSSLRDLHRPRIKLPTLKRWAIIGHPSGMMSGRAASTRAEEIFNS